jgi:bifunctional DNase/RNase
VVEVQVFGLIMDEESRAPVMVLRAVEGEETLPIQIGFAEAASIAAALENIEVSRPMTHDLLMVVLDTLDASIERVEITDLRDSVFVAEIHLKKGRRTFKIDCRPSDAAALALRAGAQIFVADEVFLKAAPADAAEASRLQWLAFFHALEASENPDSILDSDPEKTVH